MIHPGIIPFASFHLVIVLPVFIRFTASDYLFGIFKLFYKMILALFTFMLFVKSDFTCHY
jgi:hypothetical protein